jgi:chromosomal replication initiation ATPase DnaA
VIIESREVDERVNQVLRDCHNEINLIVSDRVQAIELFLYISRKHTDRKLVVRCENRDDFDSTLSIIHSVGSERGVSTQETYITKHTVFIPVFRLFITKDDSFVVEEEVHTNCLTLWGHAYGPRKNTTHFIIAEEDDIDALDDEYIKYKSVLSLNNFSLTEISFTDESYFLVRNGDDEKVINQAQLRYLMAPRQLDEVSRWSFRNYKKNKVNFNELVVGDFNNDLYTFLSRNARTDCKIPGLFLVKGPSGTGKTAMMNAFIKDRMDCYLISTFELMSRLVRSIQFKDDNWSRILSSHDVIILDDFQAVKGKIQTQREIMDFISHHVGRGKTVICVTNEMKLGNSFSNMTISKLARAKRFELSYPDFCSRFQIIKSLARRSGMELSDAVVDELLKNCNADIHNLVGRVSKLSAYYGTGRVGLSAPEVRELFS